MLLVKKHDQDYLLLFQSLFGYVPDLHILNYLNCSMFSSLAISASFKKSLTRIYYSKLYSLSGKSSFL